MAVESPQTAPSIRTLLTLSFPAIIVGVISALGLFAVEEVAVLIEHFLWGSLPAAWGIDPDSRWWIFGVLSLTGLAIGLSVRFAPGHGGRDSATTELIAPPVSLAAVPGVIVVTVLGLAGGVSLGPEIPIIAINTALLVALIAHLWPSIPSMLIVMVTAAGTIGALFGTPVAAALVFTGVVAGLKEGGALWDRLFLPLASAGAGSITMRWLDGPQLLEAGMPPLGAVDASDLIVGTAVAAFAALLGLAAAAVFGFTHNFFHRLGNPIIYITLGGVLLGLLGALGGPLTLFKGGSQMVELFRNEEDYSLGQLFLIIAVKLAALVIAASAGFRGGRIFPAVFIGVAVGLAATSIAPELHPGLAIACGTLGVVLAIARDGWIALFIAVIVIGDVTVLPVLCLAILPVWLIVSKAPEMLIHNVEPQSPETHPPTDRS